MFVDGWSSVGLRELFFTISKDTETGKEKPATLAPLSKERMKTSTLN